MSRPEAALPALDPLAGPRKSALLLHAMPAESRLWLLDQLPPAEAETLRGLLEELCELGIPADRELLHDVLADAAAGEAKAPTDAEAQWALIDKAGPGSLWLALRDEPAGLIARFLALSEWRWERGFLDQLGPAKRHQVQALLAQFRRDDRMAAADQLRSQLLARLSARLSDFETRWVLDQTLAAARGPRARLWWRRLQHDQIGERRSR
jgi:hypothetical protein